MRRLTIGVLPLFLLSPSLAAGQDAEALLSASRETAGQLIQQLGAQLRAELAKGGPEGAVVVCRTIAPELAGRLSRDTGWRVSRVSLKTRNPLLGAPDAWEQRGLVEFDRRVAARDKAENQEVAVLGGETAGRYYRYM